MPNLQESRPYSFGASPAAGLRPYSSAPDSLSVSNSLSPPGNHVIAHSPPSGGQVANLSQQQQLPPACGARQLSKLKRFLTTLQQFGADISPGIGDHVRALVLALVNSQLSVEEFHAKLQQATNFPLRPFVIPFLKANLPLLQRELLHCAHLARQSPHQYLMHHDHSVLDVTAPAPQQPQPGGGRQRSPREDRAITAATPETSSPGAVAHGSGKRKSPDDRARDMSAERHSSDLSKRIRTTPPSPISGGVKPHPPLVGGPGYPGVGPSPHLSTSGTSSTAAVARYVDDDVNFLRDLREINRVERDQIDRDTPIDARIHSTISNGSHSPDKLSSSVERVSDDLKRVESLLQNIVEMVDECKSVVKSLRQQRQLTTPRSVDSQADVNQKTVAEAVSEVKRQAMAELRKTVAESELKASQLIAAERARLDAVVSEARKQAVDEILLSLRAPHESSEACWNCGRKATETCSGCNSARYCGSFCQHKDWESHHKICGTGAAGRQTTAAGGGRSTSQNSRSPTPGALQLDAPKQETTNDDAVADSGRTDGDRSSRTSPEEQLSTEPTKRETPSETD